MENDLYSSNVLYYNVHLKRKPCKVVIFVCDKNLVKGKNDCFKTLLCSNLSKIKIKEDQFTKLRCFSGFLPHFSQFPSALETSCLSCYHDWIALLFFFTVFHFLFTVFIVLYSSIFFPNISKTNHQVETVLNDLVYYHILLPSLLIDWRSFFFLFLKKY